MTQTTIKLAGKQAIETIGKGSILKRSGDLFIVSEVAVRKEDDVIQRALSSSHMYSSRATARYALISLSTGDNYFKSLDPLPTLLRKAQENGRFEVVHSLEITEIR